MLKTLVIKELRESAGLVALAVLAALFALASLTGVPSFMMGRPVLFPYMNITSSLAAYMISIIGGLAIAIGLKQTAWESGQNTYYFLLHRPVSRQMIFGTKLAIGLGLVLTLGALMILVYALWAATPGNNAAPFFWSMTVEAWQRWLCLAIVYLGAFLSGIRPARWFGTRLAPLVTAGAAAFGFAKFPWWWLTLAAVVIAALALVAAIFYYVEERDY
ncbi:MAG: hypothetical protein L0Z07_01400 [Planctomycetes bacterium]|nr:hypothetical protein [Planctomycetota bacterium]